MQPLAVDVREAGRLTSLSHHTIRAYIRRGKLRAVKAGRRVLVPISALQELCEQGLPIKATQPDKREHQ